MTFEQALKKLNIEEYGERIFNSNSHGELFHLADYIFLAEVLDGDQVALFREEFLKIVDWAGKTWKRPESVYQHILTIISEGGMNA